MKKLTFTDYPIITTPIDSANLNLVQSNIAEAVDSGFIDTQETWTYASATTITVPSGAVSKYQKGDKIKLTQTTVKYFYVVGVADTLLTITGGTSYVLTNATITNNYYSHVENPLGFPAWMTCASPSFTSVDNGTGGQQPTIANTTFKIVNNEVKLKVNMGTVVKNGTGVSFYFTIPATLPSLAGTNLEALGSCYIGGIDALGVPVQKSATEICVIHPSITDNTSMPSTSINATYKY